MGPVGLVDKVDECRQERQYQEQVLLGDNPEQRHAELVQQVQHKVRENRQR